MPAAHALTDEHMSQVARFVAATRAAGRTPWPTTERAARTFCGRLERAGGFDRMALAGQIEAVKKAPTFAAWLMVTGQLRVRAELLDRADLRLGIAARNHLPDAHAWFANAAERIGTRPADISLQWSTLAKITALTGLAPEAVADAEFEDARRALVGAFHARATPESGRNPAATFHRLRLTLYHAGRLASYARPAGRDPVSVTGWVVVAPRFAEAARRHVAQVALSLRPTTVTHIEHDLREFGTWLQRAHPEVGSCAELRRHRIEAYKAWLHAVPRALTGKPLNRVSIKNALTNLRCFFERITEWGYPDAPERPLVFMGDLPIADKPLPHFLDDTAAAKLPRAARADEDPLSRLIVELLARTGIRSGELLGLTCDSVVKIGSAFWLRIPIGKLHSDRYIPLHPQLKELLDDWVVNHRPHGLRSDRLLVERSRPIARLRVADSRQDIVPLSEVQNRQDIVPGWHRPCTTE